MNKKAETKYIGTGFLSLLCLLFIGLKLGNVITWSWWWVFAPLWGQVVLALVFFLIVFIVYLGIEAVKSCKK